MMSTIAQLLLALALYQTVAASEEDYPKICTPSGSYDFIVIGAGTAGSIIASRLSEDPNAKVLAIEAGSYPPQESELPGLFGKLPQSQYDYNITSVDDGYTARNQKGLSIKMTQGKILGGSSAINLMMYFQGNAFDYQQWVEATGDETWSFENLLPYFKQTEQVTDQEIMNSEYAKYHGASGNLKLARDPNPINKEYLEAMNELGHKIKIDISGEQSSGFVEPLYAIADGKRQSNALAFLGPAKDRTNLCLSLGSTVTKIIIVNGVATGIVAVDSEGKEFTVTATKEIIVCAGALNSPKLLLLSGIGPKEDLEKLNIEVIVDLPVGENFQDRGLVTLAYQMETNTDEAATADLTKFPVPATLGYNALNAAQTHSDYQTALLVMPHDSDAIFSMCSDVLNYNDNVCAKWTEANKGRTVLFVVQYIVKPNSRGKVFLTSSDPSVPPSVYMGTYSDKSDLTLMTQTLVDFSKFQMTKLYTSAAASLIDVGVCSSASSIEEYWRCYAVEMSANAWHYVGTCAMGSVLDSNLKVRGISNLRVADSSSMPTPISGEIMGGVNVVAERAAAFISSEWANEP